MPEVGNIWLQKYPFPGNLWPQKLPVIGDLWLFLIFGLFFYYSSALIAYSSALNCFSFLNKRNLA
jgi:hypothetical protein